MKRVVALHGDAFFWRPPNDTDTLIRFASESEARVWLHRGAHSPTSEGACRQAVSSLSTDDTSRWTTGDVLAFLAHALAQGKMRAVRGKIVIGRIHDEPMVEPAPAAKLRTWIGIELVDDRDPPRPVPFELFRLLLTDGSIHEGTLDRNGRARVEGIDAGTCKVTFPNFHGPDWKKR